MKHTISMILPFALLALNAFTGRAQTPATNQAQGSLSEIRNQPFAFLDMHDKGKRQSVANEIIKDPNGRLVPLETSERADFIIAFINAPKPPKQDAKSNTSTSSTLSALDPAWITSDHKGQMVVYRRTREGQVRILWVDPKGTNRPVKAIKDLLKALETDGKNTDMESGEKSPTTQETISPISASLRPEILYKEKAKYTEEARRNKVSGIVVLNLVFQANGKITNIRVVRGLPDGLTEQAIHAAKKIRFRPAMRNGQRISVRGNLEFNFSLY